MVFKEVILSQTEKGKYRIDIIHDRYFIGLIPMGQYKKYTYDFNSIEEAKYWTLQHLSKNNFKITDNVFDKLTYSDVLKLDGKKN